MSDLKPCPFCGGTKIKMYSFGSSDLHGFSHFCKINGEVMVKVESRFFETEEEAAEVWNRRAVNVPDTNVGDTISRQAAIDALWAERERLNAFMDKCLKNGYTALRASTKSERNRIEDDINIIESLPAAQPQVKCVAKVTMTDEQVKEAFENAKLDLIATHQLTQLDLDVAYMRGKVDGIRQCTEKLKRLKENINV